MPTYVYLCRQCGEDTEVIERSIHAEPLTICPKCGGGIRRRILPPMTILYKGQGWEATRYDIRKDYFGLQKELREVAERRRQRKGSREERLETEERLSAESDSRRREAR